MATHRKSGGSGAKAKKPVKKTAAKPKPKPKRPAVAAKRPAAAPKGRGVPPKAKPTVKVVAGKSAATKKAAAAATRVEVRPLGVLPPESIARTPHRPAAVAPAPAQRPARPARPLATQDAGGVTEKDYGEFEQRHHTERRKILKEMGHLENTVLKVNPRDSAGDLSGYSFHMADVGTDAMEREKAFLFASAEGRLLMEINEALRRVYNKAYGICEECGQPIARARLEAMPTARLCLRCKEKEERAARGLS
jgi:RNA polymerase-binding protein DksA